MKMSDLNDEDRELVAREAQKLAASVVSQRRQEQLRDLIRSEANRLLEQDGFTPPSPGEHWRRQEEIYFEQLTKGLEDRRCQVAARERFRTAHLGEVDATEYLGGTQD